MNASRYKSHLKRISEQVDDNTSLEDIYNHLALLNDIELSEDQEKKGQIVSHNEVEKRSSKWLK